MDEPTIRVVKYEGGLHEICEWPKGWPLPDKGHSISTAGRIWVVTHVYHRFEDNEIVIGVR